MRVRVGGACQGAGNGGEIKRQNALVFGGFQSVCPQTSVLGVLLYQGHLLVFTAGQLQIVDGLAVNVEHRSRRTVFRCHIGDGGAVTYGQAVCAFAVEFQIGTHHTLLAQELGQGQYHVCAGDARLQLACELNTHNIRQSHHGGTAKHHALGFQAANTHGDNAQGIHHGGVAVCAYTGVREGDALTFAIGTRLNYRGHFLQVDLVHDAVAGRDYVHVLERGFGPVDEVEAVVVAAVFDGPVFLERIFLEAGVFYGQGVIHD